MKNLFSLDNPVMIFLGKVADLVILNLLFVFCSAPIITVGASATAMCYVTLKARDGYEGSVMRYFFKAFKENFFQATGMWLILLLLAILLRFNYGLINTVGMVMRIVIYVCTAVLAMVALYAFFLQARFQNTVLRTLRNALVLAIGNAPRSILAGVLTVAVVWLSLFSPEAFGYALPVWTIIGFAAFNKLLCRILCSNIGGLGPARQETE